MKQDTHAAVNLMITIVISNDRIDLLNAVTHSTKYRNKTKIDNNMTYLSQFRMQNWYFEWYGIS